MINAGVFLVCEELLPRYKWKTRHSTVAVVNTLQNLHVYLVTARITVSVTGKVQPHKVPLSSLLNNITSGHFSFHLAEWGFG